MFEFLFKYPSTVFSKGTFVLLGRWPVWILFLAMAAVAGALAWSIWRRRFEAAPSMRGIRSVGVWGLQTLLVALLLLLLWQPALSVATLRPQQNVVAVVIDDSRSMATQDMGSKTRKEAAVNALNDGLDFTAWETRSSASRNWIVSMPARRPPTSGRV
jgi:hypothetical protein